MPAYAHAVQEWIDQVMCLAAEDHLAVGIYEVADIEYHTDDIGGSAYRGELLQIARKLIQQLASAENTTPFVISVTVQPTDAYAAHQPMFDEANSMRLDILNNPPDFRLSRQEVLDMFLLGIDAIVEKQNAMIERIATP